MPMPSRPAISAADLAAWLERRRRVRRRLTAVVVVLFSVGVAALTVYWTAFNRHLMAMAHLQSRDFMVDWDISLENLSTGGTTYVAFQPSYSWHRRSVNAEDLESLKRLNHVRSLDLSGLAMLRDDDLSAIAGLGDLEELELSRQAQDAESAVPVNPLGDKVLDHVKGLTRLKTLGLAGDRITDTGLAKLANLRSLEMLDLDGTLVTNAGLDALVGLRALKTLRVEKTRVTRKGATRFQQKRPDVEVIRESPSIEEPGTPAQ
ncbi:MAG TPA: hypothetical protein VGH33_16365 [Isosphaeraceae bacterium]